MPPLSHPTSCTPTTSNLYLANSLAATISKPALYRLLTFQAVAYPGILFRGGRGSTNSVEDREKRDLGAAAP